jgi:hypothetical protein
MRERGARRCIPRRPIGVQLLVDGYVAAHAELADLSLGGACVWMGGGFRSGDTFEFRLETDSALPFSFRTTAKVVWSRAAMSGDGRTRCGVCWDHIASADQDRLERLIAAACAGH